MGAFVAGLPCVGCLLIVPAILHGRASPPAHIVPPLWHCLINLPLTAGSRRPCTPCPAGRTTADNPLLQRYATDCVVKPGFGIVSSTSLANGTAAGNSSSAGGSEMSCADAYNPDVSGISSSALAALPVLECPVGYYSNGNSAGAKCTACPAGSTTQTSGSTNVTDCNGAGVCGRLWVVLIWIPTYMSSREPHDEASLVIEACLDCCQAGSYSAGGFQKQELVKHALCMITLVTRSGQPLLLVLHRNARCLCSNLYLLYGCTIFACPAAPPVSVPSPRPLSSAVCMAGYGKVTLADATCSLVGGGL